MHRQFVFLVCVFVIFEVDLLSAAAVTNERQVTAGRDSPVAWPECLKAGRQRRAAESTQWKYAVIIDAGSSGSRVRVYRWPTPVGEARVALQSSGVMEINSTKVRPRLSSAANLQRVSDDIHRLLSFAGQVVPRTLQRRSPVYLMATAGMRLLMEDKVNRLMRHIGSILSNSSFNPFHYASKYSSRILSGEEEGVFAWIATNYLLGVFSKDRHSRNETVAILEMGGASTQIAFVPKGSILADLFPLLLAGRRYHIYAHSYLPYGWDEVNQRVRRLLANSNTTDSSQPIDHPCMLRGDNMTDDKLNRVFVGTGDPSGCLRILNNLLHKAKSENCYPKPCGIGVFYQPRIDSNAVFYAVGAFHYALRATGAVTNDNNVFVPRTGFEKATEYCSKDIGDVLPATANADEHRRVTERCLRALYVATLITRGYGFSNDTQQIRVVEKINQQPIEWTLGAVLYEDELATIKECGCNSTVDPNVASPVSTTHWTLSLTLLFYALQHIRPPV